MAEWREGLNAYRVTPVLDRSILMVERESDGRVIEVKPLDVVVHVDGGGTLSGLFNARFAADEVEHPVARTMLVLKR